MADQRDENRLPQDAGQQDLPDAAQCSDTEELPAPVCDEQDGDGGSKIEYTGGASEPRKPGFLKGLWFSMANAVYQYCYFVGIQLMRSTRIRRRKLGHGVLRLERRVVDGWKKEWHNIRINSRMMRRDLLEPLRTLKDRFEGLRQEAEDAKRRGENRVLVSLKIFGYVLHSIWRALRFIFNYAAPIAAIAYFVITVSETTSETLALRVEYNGKELGYISDESVFNQAENDMKARIVNEAYITPENIIPKFELTQVEPDKLISVDDLTDRLISASGNELEEADGLYIQGRFVSAVTDGEALLAFMSDMLDRYAPEDMDAGAKIQFVKRIQLKPGLYPVSSVKPLEEVQSLLTREERGEKRYTVIAGDDPLKIAAKNGITFAELKALNPNVDVSLLPGDSLLISQSVPYLGVQVTTTEQYEEEIPYQIKQETDPDKDIGWAQVLQEGKKGTRRITAEVKMIDGIVTERVEVARDIIEQPVDEILQVGGNQPLKFIPTNSTGTLPKGVFGWPAGGGGSITTGFLGYYGHTGSDITFSGCYGTPVVASMDGVVSVVKAQYVGYGYHVVIEHGGGVQTLYAHMSKLYVQPGQEVKQGELIGLIGRTGNATGPHLHFEIRMNGTPVNAAPYLYGQK